MKKAAWVFATFFVLAAGGMNIASIELTWEKVQGLKYRLSAIVYAYDVSSVEEKLPVSWGDNTVGWLDLQSIENIPGHFMRITYTGSHTYTGPGYFTASVHYVNRPPGISNILLSQQEAWYVEAKMLVTTVFPTLRSPRFDFTPEEKVCVAENVTMFLQASDPDGDEVKYVLQPCLRENNTPIPSYTLPLSFNGFTLDENNGLLHWQPAIRGLFAYSVRVEKYRQGVLIGTIMRDAIVQAASCQLGEPTIHTFDDTCVTINQTFIGSFNATLPTADSIFVSLHISPKLDENPPLFSSGGGTSSFSSTLSWTPVCSQVRKDPYFLTFYVQSNHHESPNSLLNNFDWFISPFTASSSGFIGSPCGKTWDSTYHVWFGKDSTAPRHLTSPLLNLSNGEYLLLFDMRYAKHTGEPNTYCEGPDEPDEGVYLQISSDGVNWTTLVYFNPAFPVDSPGTLASLTRWENYAIAIPTAFLLPNVRIRWVQMEATDADYDHWGVDNVRLLKISLYKNLTLTRQIQVIAPPVQNVQALSQGNAVLITWDTATCLNAQGYFIYRRIDSSGFHPSACETGLPPFAGFVCIDTLHNIYQTSYLDDNHGLGLPAGNVYCYRIIYWFTDGAESKASDEVCAYVSANVPIITHVSVLKTDVNQGKIWLSWVPPLELDTLAYQPPFRYVVYRQQQTNEVPIAYVEGLTANSLIDSALNTLNLPYVYRVALEAGNGTSSYHPVGQAFPATSVFLHIEPENKALQLSWNYQVPWAVDYTVVYRWNETMQQFDSIGMNYTNSFRDSNLLNNKTYCYKVETVGHYSHPSLPRPLRNFSQQVCALPRDTEAPCPPVLFVHTSCQHVRNELSWLVPDSCNYDDFKAFVVKYKSMIDAPWAVLDSIFSLEQQQYVHVLTNTVAGCYAISAVDSSGNESSLSNVVCVDIDSCSLYALPNVFTPNGDGYNDLFRPFPYDFVEKIDLNIFNRWGVKVFSTTDPDIGWDGKCIQTGKPCADGVYFFTCDVYEWTLHGLRRRLIKGTVHIYR